MRVGWWPRAAVAVVAAVAVAGCGAGAGEQPCTGIGSPSGISVDVEPPMAKRVEKATIRVCWDGNCEKPDLELRPSTSAAPASCTGDDPDDACMASAVPTGGKHGFAELSELPERTVTVRLVLRDGEDKLLLAEKLDVEPQVTYPNGRRCGKGGTQAQLVVTNDKVKQRG